MAGTAAHVEAVVRAHKRVTADDVDRQVATRSLSWRQDDDGSMVLQLRVPAAIGAAVVAAVTEATTPEAGVPIAAKRADALVDLILGPDIATPMVLILTTADTLAGGPGPCVTDQGIAIDLETAAMAACDGPVITADHDHGADPDHDRASDQRGFSQHRYPTVRTRRHLLTRDRTCRFTDCHQIGRRHAHHLVHWIHGGPRNPGNLVLLCPGHHRLVHRHHLNLRFEADHSISAWTAAGQRIDTPIAPLHITAPNPPDTPVPYWAGERLDLDHILTCLDVGSERAGSSPPISRGKLGPDFPQECE